MPGFFAHARGSVKQVQGPWQQVADFRTAIDGVNFAPRNIITQVGVVQNGNFQFLHTINSDIFVYVFGDRMSEMRIGGVSFAHECESGQNGADDIFKTYDENRIAEKAEPLIITVGRTPFSGFLTGSQFGVSDAELMLGSWSFQLHVTAQDT